MKRIFLLLTWAAVITCRTSAGSDPSPFTIRGTLPWHNFLCGPTAWNEEDYAHYLDELQRLGLNYVTFHCYTGGAERYAPYVEPLIRLEYRDVLPLATLDTSLTARWGYRPLRVSEFAFGTSKRFTLPRGADAFGADCAVRATSNEDHYRRAQHLMRRVVRQAHARGIQVGLGFEFGIHPPEFASIVPPESMIRGALLPDPTHPASREILQRTLDDILRAYPEIDWIWLWLHEHTMHVGQPALSGAFRRAWERDRAYFSEANNEAEVFTGVWSLNYIRAAQDYLAQRAPQVRLAISGWGGGTQLPGTLRGLDRALPTNIVFTCLNPNQGWSPQPEVLAEIARHRAVWAIPWLEGDARLWHLQPRVNLLREQVQLAAQQRLPGVLAIHWRTEETRLNLAAFARFAAHPAQAPSVEDFYLQECRTLYGPAAGQEIAQLMARWDREQTIATDSPEYYAYSPAWGRLKPELRQGLLTHTEALRHWKTRVSGKPFRANLDWLVANLEFTLLLDEVGRHLEPAYQLKERSLQGESDKPTARSEALAARKSLETAPMEDLFRTYARRVRSRGELGELSSLNQRVWLQYRELVAFIDDLLKRTP